MSGSKKTIVLITAWYPPLQSVAVNRMLAFAKYLDAEKYQLTIITVGNDACFGESNEDGVDIIRIKPKTGFWRPAFKSSDPKMIHYSKVARRKLRTSIFGDHDSAWLKEAFQALEKVSNQKKIDLILSSFSPVEPHLVALKFCKKNPGTKWIVDMRDEMSLNPQTDKVTQKRYAKIEKEINIHAHALVSVSEPIVEYFKTAIPDLKYYIEVRNGFDHDLMDLPYHFNEEFTMLHAGSFYGVRKPDTLFKAMENLHKKNELPKNWKFICAGASRNFSIPPDFKKNVEILDRVSQTESLKLMAAADLNILIQPPTGRMGVYTGKIFDYLSVNKPILAVVDKRDVGAQLINKLKAGYVADFGDIAEIEDQIKLAIDQWKHHDELKPEKSEIIKLHRKHQVHKLNLLIQDLLHE
jgi:glycosyltransferase involved in cell wall biosynthesis